MWSFKLENFLEKYLTVRAQQSSRYCPFRQTTRHDFIIELCNPKHIYLIRKAHDLQISPGIHLLLMWDIAYFLSWGPCALMRVNRNGTEIKIISIHTLGYELSLILIVIARAQWLSRYCLLWVHNASWFCNWALQPKKHLPS